MKALIETYSISDDSKLLCLSMICLASYTDMYRIMKRSAYIKEAGEVLHVSTIEDPPIHLDRRVECINISVVKQTIPRNDIEEYVEKFESKNEVKRRYCRRNYIHLIFSEDTVIVGRPLFFRDTKSMNDRSPSRRPFFRSIALSVQLSRAMINLSRAREGDLLLDPFAGTGSILIEAGLMGMKPIGVEIDWELIHGAQENLEYLGIPDYVLILGDSTTMNLRDVDAITTDPPYGRAASTHGLRSEDVYERFLYKSSEWLRRRKHMVFLAPHYLVEKIDEILCDTGFITRVKIPYYVHGGLTRIIYVVYKP